MRKLLLIIISILAVSELYAQITTSSIEGKVVDNDDQIVVYAIVTAIHQDSGTQYYALTNEQGYFVIDGMRPGGPYTIEFSCLGYNSTQYYNIYLELACPLQLKPILQENFEILDAAIVVYNKSINFTSDRNGAVTNISMEQISSIPTEERTITDITRLSVYGGNGLNLAGGNGRLVNFTIDAANFNNNLGLGNQLPGGGSPISIETLAEVQVAVSPYDVRQNNFTVAGINAVTKSGTNKYEASVYQYYNQDRLYTIGTSLSGPIIKNKLFIFANFEYLTSPKLVNQWRASEDGIANVAEKISRTSIKDLNLVSHFVKQRYNYDTGSYTDFNTNNPNIKFLARLDWNISDAHKLSFRYNYTCNTIWTITNDTSVDGAAVLPKARSSSSSMVYFNSLYKKDNDIDTWSINLNSRISTKLHNEFLATYSRINDKRTSNSEPFPFIDILQKDESGLDQHYISLGYEPFSWNNNHYNNVLTAKDDLIYYTGKHKLMLGLSIENQILYDAYMRNGYGYYRYSSVDDFLNEQAPETVCLTYGYDGNANPAAILRFNNYSAYLQDEWSVTDNLRLTYGLRLETLVYNNKDLIKNPNIYAIDYSGNGYHLIDGHTYTPEQEAKARRIDNGRWPNSNINFSPRLGFVWDVFGDKSLKIRGGTGVFTGRIPLVLLLNMPINSSTYQYQAIFNGTGQFNADIVDMSLFKGGLITDNNGRPTMVALRDYIIANDLAPKSLETKKDSFQSILAAVSPSFKMPQTLKTTLGFDYKVPSTFPLTISGELIYNKTISDMIIKDWSIRGLNELTNFDGYDQRTLYTPLQKHLYYYDDEDNYISVPNAYVLENTNKGYGFIYSLSLNTNPIKGLNLSLSYTHTKTYTLSDIPNDKLNAFIPYVPTYQGFNYPELHLSPNIIPNRFLLTSTYTSTKGTMLSIIYEAVQGKKNYTYMVANDLNGDGFQYDLIYVPKDSEELLFVSEDDKNRFMDYVNNNKYLSSRKGQYTSAYSIYSPWFHKIDLRLSQDINFQIGKTSNIIQLSVNINNFLNLLNPQWGLMKIMNPELGDGRILKFEQTFFDVPQYSTPATVKGNTPTWVNESNTIRHWGIQFGIKYIIK